MRIIKFRAWNGKGMIISGETDIKYYIEASSGRVCWLERYDQDDWGMASTSTWELMQCTGLKDCNDVEIYEGDVGLIGTTQYTVCWNEAGAFFDLAWENSTDMDTDFLLSDAVNGFPMFEIIGNIYENPNKMEAK